jgi:hypothetical protein
MANQSSASRRAAKLREQARALADQSRREKRQDRASYLAEQAATRAAAMLDAPPAPTLWNARPVGTAGPKMNRC